MDQDGSNLSIRVAVDDKVAPKPKLRDCGVVTVFPTPNVFTALGRVVLKVKPEFRAENSSTSRLRLTCAIQSKGIGPLATLFSLVGEGLSVTGKVFTYFTAFSSSQKTCFFISNSICAVPRNSGQVCICGSIGVPHFFNIWHCESASEQRTTSKRHCKQMPKRIEGSHYPPHQCYRKPASPLADCIPSQI